MFLVKTELEVAELCLKCRIEIMGATDDCPLDLMKNQSPFDLNSLEGVDDLFVCSYGDFQVVLFIGFTYFQSSGRGGDFGTQVDLCGFIELVWCEPVVFVDDDGELRGETMEEGVQGGEDVVLEVAWYEIIYYGADKNY